MQWIDLMLSYSGAALVLALWHALYCALAALAGRPVGAVGAAWALPVVAGLQMAGTWGGAAGPGLMDLLVVAGLAAILVVTGVLDWQEGALLAELSIAAARPALAATGVAAWQLVLGIGAVALAGNLAATALRGGLPRLGLRWRRRSLPQAAEQLLLTTAVTSGIVIAGSQLLGRSVGVIGTGLAVVALEWALRMTGFRDRLRWLLYPLAAVGVYYAWIAGVWLPLALTAIGARATLWAAEGLYRAAPNTGGGAAATPVRMMPAALVVGTVLATSFSGVLVALLGLMG